MAKCKTTIEVTKKYGAGHTYTEYWGPADVYCPGCGDSKVWVELGDGDYYIGNSHLCLECGALFYLPFEPSHASDEFLQVLKQLRTKNKIE